MLEIECLTKLNIKMDNILTRISQFCEYEKISEDYFFTESGIERSGNLNKKSMLNLKQRFPELNRDWLLTNKGEMINPSYKGLKRVATTAADRFKEVLNLLQRRGIVTNQKDLAQKLGYNRSYFSQLVNTRILTAETCYKLTEFLPDLNVDYLMSGFGTLLVTAKEEEEINSASKSTMPSSPVEGDGEKERLMRQVESLTVEISKQGERIDNVLDIIKILTGKS